MIVPSSTGGHQLKVEVRFGTEDHRMVTAYIYRESNHLQHKSTVPIVYENSNPQNVFYATPGDRAVTPIWLSVGGAMLLAGFSFLAWAIRWRRQIAIASQIKNWQSVYLYHWKSLQMVTVFQKGGPRYTWTVFRRTLPSTESQTSPAIFETTQTEPVRRRSTLARTLSRFLYSIKTDAVTWPVPTVAELSGDLGPYGWLVIRSSGEFLVPNSRATPVVGTGHTAATQLIVDSALLSAHRRLLAAYAMIRYQARLLPRFAFVALQTEDEGKLMRDRLLCSRLLVQLHVDYHVRRQLRRITDTYLRAQMLASGTSEEADKKRHLLNELREDCELLTNSAAYTTGRAASALIGLATLVPLIAIVARIPQLQFTRFLGILLTIALIILLILPGGLALMTYNQSFRCKIRLFSSSSLPGVLINKSEKNTYDIEDTLFALIQQSKRPERASERWAYGTVLAALIIFITRSLLSLPFNVITGFAIAWACYLIVAIYRSSRRRKR